MNVISILILIAVFLILLPFIVYYCVKFGTAAFYQAKRSFSKNVKTKAKQ